MNKFLFFFAVIAWISGLLVHILSLADVDVAGNLPFVWILHIGIFVVWIPMILHLRKNEELKQFRQLSKQDRTNSASFINIIFKQTPTWLKTIAIAGFFYAMINFFIFSISESGNAAIRDGHYVLQSHGQFIRTLTEQEYHHFKANEVRGFSGHWIAFYGVAAAILFPFHRQKNG